jgi:hypothetical protein
MISYHGERSFEESQAMPKKTPSLSDVDTWLDSGILRARTTNAGFSPNRIINGPRAIIMGNQSDPNGLCGDAAAYVVDRFIADMSVSKTSDGYAMGLVLWQGAILNHIANIMLVSGKTEKQSYEAVGDHLNLKKPLKGKSLYNMGDLSNLHVYDLYYKNRSNALDWWKDRDSSLGGCITFGIMSNIAD